jgi:hypothetical protein
MRGAPISGSGGWAVLSRRAQIVFRVNKSNCGDPLIPYRGFKSECCHVSHLWSPTASQAGGERRLIENCFLDDKRSQDQDRSRCRGPTCRGGCGGVDVCRSRWLSGEVSSRGKVNKTGLTSSFSARRGVLRFWNKNRLEGVQVLWEVDIVLEQR